MELAVIWVVFYLSIQISYVPWNRYLYKKQDQKEGPEEHLQEIVAHDGICELSSQGLQLGQVI